MGRELLQRVLTVDELSFALCKRRAIGGKPALRGLGGLKPGVDLGARGLERLLLLRKPGAFAFEARLLAFGLAGFCAQRLFPRVE